MAVDVGGDDMDQGWRARLVRALSVELAHERAERPRDESARQAGVLIAVVAAAEPFIYFTQRSDALTHHPGQISFPGGRMEAWDASIEAAALRESQEEIGLAPEAVAIVGRLAQYSTVTGFTITPVVGWVVADAAVEPDGREVERIFRVPLSFAMAMDNYRRHAVAHDGRDYEIYSINYRGNHIWGATAAILHTLARQLAHAEGQRPTPPSWAEPGLAAASGVPGEV